MAAEAVAAYEDLVEALQSIHKEQTLDVIEWYAISQAEPGPQPRRSTRFEDQALQVLTDYHPSVLDRLLKRTERRVDALERAVMEGKRKDDAAYARALAEHEASMAELEKERLLADRVLRGELEAFREVLEAVQPFGSISDLGSNVMFSISKEADAPEKASAVRVLVDVHVHGKDIIPREVRRLLKSGRMSAREMPASQFHQLHQDYVCGCVLRVANETLAMLPVPQVVVTALDEMLNPATGHVEETPIVSALIPRRTMATLNLAGADPSEAMGNFLHRMSFRKTQGFSPIQRLSKEDIPV